MIRSLRFRFIRIVMVAFLAVLLVILLGVNLVNRHNVYAGIDARLAFLGESSMGPPIGMLMSTPPEVTPYSPRWRVNRPITPHRTPAARMEISYFFITKTHLPEVNILLPFSGECQPRRCVL